FSSGGRHTRFDCDWSSDVCSSDLAGGDTRTAEVLRAEALKKTAALAGRGFDLGFGHAAGYEAPTAVEARLEKIYRHARRALYSKIGRAAGRGGGTITERGAPERSS